MHRSLIGPKVSTSAVISFKIWYFPAAPPGFRFGGTLRGSASWGIRGRCPPRMPENFRKIFYNIFSIGGTFLVPPPLAAPMIKRVIQFKKRIKMRELLIKCCIENKQKPSQSNDDRRKWSWMSVIIFKKIGLGNMGKFARIEFNG